MVIELLQGKTFTKVENINNDELHFYCQDGTHYRFFHEQDCCECVSIEDITGNLDDLINSPLTMAEVESNSEDDEDGSHTYTYYKFATIKGYVTVRWYGESNGYYSESVDLEEIIDVGNRVEVVKLFDCDEGIIEIGDFGIIGKLGETDTSREYDVFDIKLDKDISKFDETKYANINQDGTYAMFRCQFKVIKD